VGLIKRRRPGPATDPAEDSVVEEVLEPEADTADEVEEPGESVVEVRALRAQVRVLEEALQRVIDPPSLEEYRTLVRVAVRAVALGTAADADPRATVARVAAAIQRIDRPAAGRVALPPAPPATATVAPPIVAEEPEAVAEPDSTDEPVEPTDAEVVLPVPPPAPAVSRRARRRRTHSAA
jgi:hypothetical protein